MNLKTKTLVFATAVALLFPLPLLAQDDVPPEALDPAEIDPTELIEAEELEEATEDALDEVEDAALENLADSDDSKNWSIGYSARMNVGQGTFARLSNDTIWADEIHDGSGFQNRVNMAFSVNPSYTWNDFTFSSSLSFNQWLTAGGGSIRPYEGRFGGIGINSSGRFTGINIEQLGLRVTPTASVNIPILRSPTQRTSTFRGSLGGGASLSKTFFRQLTLSYSLSGSLSFFDFTSPVVDIGRIGEENAIFRAEGAEAVAPGFIAVGGINSPWSLNNSLTASFRIGQVSTSVTYAYSRRWAFDVERDPEFASIYECEGRCFGDSMRGAINLSYRINEHFNLSGGVSSGGLPKSSDQQTFNFPFWNFESAVGPSSLNIGIGGSY